MLEIGYITQTEHDAAKIAKVEFKTRESQNIKAPHFVMYIKEQLVEKYGEEMVEQGGLKVVTSLDYKLQEKAEEIVKRWSLINEEKFKATNASMVAMDPKTGQILVMVGSRDYFDTAIQGNFNIALAKRQPGSSFKPIVYAQAFKEGYTPETVVFDVPTQFSTYCSAGGDCYSPQNYDEKFRGPISFRNALAQSLNVPAVKALYLAGLRDSISLARDMGITTLTTPERYGLTLVLLEMTGAYSVFANDGIKHVTTGILKIQDRDGNIIEESKVTPTQVLSPDVAHQISSILSDNVARAPSFGSYSPLHFPGRDVAAKTGTTNDYHDTWIMGYSTRIAAGAWAGNNDNSPMQKATAGYIVAPMWNEFMQVALKELPNESFPPPPGIDPTLKPILRGVWQGGSSFTVDRETGEPATAETPPERREERITNNVHSILHWVDKENPRGPYPSNPASDPMYYLWENPVREWIGSSGSYTDGSSTVIGGGNTNKTDDGSGENNGISLSIREPDNNDRFNKTDTVNVNIKVESESTITKGEVYINNVLVGPITESFTFSPGSVPGIQENNELKVIVYDSEGNKKEDKVTFKVRQVE
jgi:membrane peptidoglycan carboxypeptidase